MPDHGPHPPRAGESHDHPADRWLAGQLDACDTVDLPIRSLLPADSPRQSGTDDRHADLLAEIAGRLPPILVHGPTMRIIDGMHRVRAAQASGARTIIARVYNGSEIDAFVIAVKMNISHGLPLGRPDRVTAAQRIITSHPDWSNRMIASATGLAPGTVGQIRKRSSDQSDQLDARIGRDGRSRPLDGAAGRRLAGRLLVEQPAASLRSIARAAGVSASTVLDVRRRVSAGEDPVSPRQRDARGGRDMPRAGAVPRSRPLRRPVPPPAQDPAHTLSTLRRDPALRFRDDGRSLLRWLDAHVGGMAQSGDMVQIVPEHLVRTVADLARSHAETWVRFAHDLEVRVVRTQLPPGSAGEPTVAGYESHNG
jgi:hypothetical protein